MNYTFSTILKSEVDIKVIIPFIEFETHLKRAVCLLSEEIEIEGFRRGKAPYDIVKNRLGEMSIYERAADLAVRKTYPEVVGKISEEERKQKREFRPIGKPEITITKLALGDDIEYKIHLSLFPKVSLPRYKEIAARAKKERKEISVSEDEVINALEWIRDSRSPLVTVSRPSQKGDRVEIDFSARSGSAPSGETRSGDFLIEKQKSFPLILGQGRFIPGFDDQIIRMKEGESKKFSLVAPEDWHDQNMANKLLDFEVMVKIVQEKQRLALDDKLAKSLGNFSSLDDLKSSIKDGIHKEKEEKERERIRALMVQETASEAEMDIPEILLQSEIEKMVSEMRSGVAAMGMKWEDYLQHIKKTEDEIKKDWIVEAEKRVRAALTLLAVAEEEQVLITDVEVEERANQFLAKYKSAEEERKEIDPEELKEYTRGVLRNEKVLELLENA